MKIEYYFPKDLDSAIGLLLRNENSAKIIAGGTDLLRMIKSGKDNSSILIDITRIDHIKGIRQRPDGSISIGAITTHHEIATSKFIIKDFLALSEGASSVGSRQIRNVATIGGNICNSSPSADTAPALLVFNARAKIIGPHGAREVLIKDFFSGPSQNVMKSDEILCEFILPSTEGECGSSYIKLSARKAMDTAIVGVAVMVQMDPDDGICKKCHIALGAVAPTAIRAIQAEEIITGTDMNQKVLEEAGEIAKMVSSPINDIRASAEYRSEMIKTITIRAIQKARENALRLKGINA